MNENLKDFPLVSCIMPTNNRRAFVPHAITYFLQQDYINKELLIVDDGTDCIEDLVPHIEQVRYIRLHKKMTLGEKRNYCIKECKGDLIMHWDDDDWMAPYRISYQVQELVKHEAEICGLQQMLFKEINSGKCWLYKYPQHAQPWLAGGSLLYTRKFWQKSPFPDMQVASDTRFIFARKLTSFVALSDYNFYIAAIHSSNTSPKITHNSLWHPVEETVVKKIIGQVRADLTKVITIPKSQNIKQENNKKKVAILITTYNRPLELGNIILHLQNEKYAFDLSFFIIDDAKLNNGKQQYWKTINMLWEKTKGQAFDYYIQLPDDMQLENHFISRSITLWRNINDPKAICLNLFLDDHRLGKTCWTNVWPKVHTNNNHRYLQTQWVDLFFICEARFFQELNWSIMPISLNRWNFNPKLSSGVGQQISEKLHGKDWHLYQVTEKLAEHVGDNSLMNPLVRKNEPIKATELPPVYAGMASIPERECFLKETIKTIAPYVNHLFLALNDFLQVPAWLSQYRNITPVLFPKKNTNKGDGGKFFGLNEIRNKNFYYFTLDDDIIYPPDYIWKMILKIEKYSRKAIVGCGGYCMKTIVNHFYNDRSNNWHISTPNTEDRPVQILHTCLTAWHSSAISFKYDDCAIPNMGDLWLALAAQKQMTPMILIERPANWVLSQPIPAAKTIYGRYHNNCTEQTTIYNSWFDWKLIGAAERN